jgi:hypothetical protein
MSVSARYTSSSLLIFFGVVTMLVSGVVLQRYVGFMVGALIFVVGVCINPPRATGRDKIVHRA